MIYDSFQEAGEMANDLGFRWFPEPGMVLIEILKEDSLGMLRLDSEKTKSPRTLYQSHCLETRVKRGQATKKEKTKLHKQKKLFLEKMKGVTGTRDFVLRNAEMLKKCQAIQFSLNNYNARVDYFNMVMMDDLRSQMRS